MLVCPYVPRVCATNANLVSNPILTILLGHSSRLMRNGKKRLSGLVPHHHNDPTQVIWDAFIADIQTKDSGKKKSKKRAARDFKAEVMKKMKVRQNYFEIPMTIIF